MGHETLRYPLVRRLNPFLRARRSRPSRPRSAAPPGGPISTSHNHSPRAACAAAGDRLDYPVRASPMTWVELLSPDGIRPCGTTSTAVPVEASDSAIAA